MISLLISLLVLGIVIWLITYLLGYLGAPDIFTKLVVVVGVLIALVMLLHGFGVWDGGHAVIYNP